MVTFICPECNHERTGQRRRCYPCTVSHTPDSRERIRQTLTGVKHSAERRKANSEGQKKRPDDKRFQLAAHMRTQPHPFAKPVGTLYTNPEGRVFVKVAEHGTWRQAWKRRAHIVWEKANGPVPKGYLIHHINEDEGDDCLENLQLVTRAEHMRLHLTSDKLRAAQLLGVAARKRNKN